MMKLKMLSVCSEQPVAKTSRSRERLPISFGKWYSLLKDTRKVRNFARLVMVVGSSFTPVDEQLVL